MSTRKELKKLKKRKAKEQANKKYFLEKRLEKQRAEKVEREEYRQEKNHAKFIKEVDLMEAQYDVVKKTIPTETRKQIENNIEILREFEENYEKEMREKRVLNEKLEKEGALTLEQKLELLKKTSKN